MAELLDQNEIFGVAFEPKQTNRFVMYVDGIPTFMIKKVSRPAVTSGKVTLDHINIKRHVKGKSEWQDVTMTLYDPIVPSAAQAVMEWFRLSHESVTGRNGYSDFYKKNIVINVIGPVGDKVEEWELRGAWPTSVTPSEVDYGGEGFMSIDVTLSIDYAILQY
jgi:hypothetical protein